MHVVFKITSFPDTTGAYLLTTPVGVNSAVLTQAVSS